jgi:hypothetical protein
MFPTFPAPEPPLLDALLPPQMANEPTAAGVPLPCQWRADAVPTSRRRSEAGQNCGFRKDISPHIEQITVRMACQWRTKRIDADGKS